MPNPKLPNTFKGQTFGDISKKIESKYKDRFDPISRRGLMAEMNSLREEQEFQRAKQQAREQLQQLLAQHRQPQDPMQMQQNPMMQQPMQAPQISASNQGVAPEIPQGDTGNFAHAASQSYNQQFGYGGNMDYGYGGQMQYLWGGWQDAFTAEPIDMSTFDTDFTANQNRIGNTTGNAGIMGLLQSQPTFRTQSNQGNAFNSITIMPSSGMESQMNTGMSGQGINPLRFAPVAANLAGLLSMRRPGSTRSELAKMGFRDRVDENLINFTPRQTQFSNVDMSQIERGINDSARAFTGANVNVSGGQAGAFRANELANQANAMNAIANARMQAQQMDRQTQAMNAQEMARIDTMLQQQGAQRAALQAQNIGLGLNMADLDARNLGAFNAARMSGIQALGQSVGNIGRESDQMTMIANALGYNSFGEYVANLPEAEKKKIFGNIFKSRKK